MVKVKIELVSATRQEARRPCAIWVCGAAASGKSRIAEAAILPLGFELVDVDQWYEDLARRHGLRPDRVEPSGEEKEREKAARRSRARAERLFQGVSSGGWTDPVAFLETLRAAVAEGEIDSRTARDLAAEVRTKVGVEPVPSEALRQALWPRMADWADPLDALRERAELSLEYVLAVARELARRSIATARAERKDLLFVETGGQTGKVLKLKEALEEEGYRTFLVWVAVRTSEIARRRDAARRTSGGRGLDPAILDRTFAIAERSRPLLTAAFNPDFIEIDNSDEGEASLEKALLEARGRARRWMGR